MKVSKREIQKSSIGELEEMLAELANVQSSKGTKLRHMVETRLRQLNA